MKLRFGWALAGVVLVVGSAAHAESRIFRLEQGTVRLDVPAGWQTPVDLFGVPLLVMSPDVTGIKQRSSLGIIPTGIETADTIADMESEKGDFKKQSEEFLSQEGGKLLEFLPSRRLQLAKGEALELGFRYTMNATDFEEKTYFIVCGRHYYHAKMLLNLRNQPRHAAVLDQLLRSFSCE